MTVSASGIITALKSLLVSDDSRYKSRVGVARDQVEAAVAGVHSANREFAVGLLAECIRRETGAPETDLPGIVQDVNRFADAQVLAGHTKTRDSQKGNAVETVVDTLRQHFGGFYSGGLKIFTNAGKEDQFNMIFGTALELLKKDGFQHPFSSDDELKAAVIEQIKSS
jgi:hypothetical protein